MTQEVLPKSEFFAEENKQKARKTRIIKAFLYYASAPIIAIAFFITFVALQGIFPFGDRVISSYDLLAQIAPFAEHFFDVFEGSSSLFYTFSIAGGTDMFGSLAYCMISPFSFIFLLGGEGMVNYMVTFVLGAKIMCIALSASFMIKRLFPRISHVIAVFLAVLYTYSGYFHVANTYINWLDFLIYFPLMLVAFRRFMQTDKYLLFSLSVSACIYCCFSIACFSLLIIFPILICFTWFCFDKNQRKEKLVKICLSLLLAVAIALPVILPALLAYTQSGRNTGIFDNLFNDLNTTHLYNKISYVTIDAVFFVFGLYYLIMSNKKEGLNKLLLVASAFIFAPVLIDEVCLLLNAGSYMSYSLRFGFLNSILGLYLTCSAISQMEATNVVSLKKRLISSIIGIILVAICSLTIVLLQEILLNGKDSIVFTWALFKEGTPIYSMFKQANFSQSFSGKFAHSIGGLEIIIFLFIAISIATATVITLYKTKVMPIKIAVVTLVCISLLQVGFSSYHTIAGNNNTMITYEQVGRVLDEIDGREDDNTQFRIKDYSDKLSADAPLTLNYRSNSVFSSVVNADNFYMPNFFGYTGNGKNSTKGRGGNVFSDSLFGYKYAFATVENISADYWKKLDANLPFYLYENKYVFPTAFKIPGKECDLSHGTYAERMDRLYTFLGGDGELTAKRTPHKINYVEDGDYFVVECYSQKGVKGNSYLVMDFPEDVKINYSSGTAYDEEDNRIVGDNFRIDAGYTKSSTYRAVCLKAIEGELTEDLIKECVYMATVSTEKVKELSQKAWENAIDVTFGSNQIIGSTNAVAGEYVFINYVALDGYSCEINGKETNIIKTDTNYLVALLENGNNEICFKYSSPFVNYILIGTLIGAILSAIVILIFKYYSRLKIALVNVIFILGNGLSIVVTGIGFVFPIVLFLYKCIKAIF